MRFDATIKETKKHSSVWKGIRGEHEQLPSKQC